MSTLDARSRGLGSSSICLDNGVLFSWEIGLLSPPKGMFGFPHEFNAKRQPCDALLIEVVGGGRGG